VRRLGEGEFRFSPDGVWVAVGDAFGAIRLVETATGREALRLTGPEVTVYEPAAFSPDGTKLVARPIDLHGLYVWDLRLIRDELRELGLDWDGPELPAAGQNASINRSPIQVTIDAGFLRAPPKVEEEGNK
jgi:hypothetical protein